MLSRLCSAPGMNIIFFFDDIKKTTKQRKALCLGKPIYKQIYSTDFFMGYLLLTIPLNSFC